MVIRKFYREKLNPKTIDEASSSHCFIELETKISKATLTYFDHKNNRTYLLEEVSVPTSSFASSNEEEYKFIDNNCISKSSINSLVSHLFSNLSKESKEGINFLLAHSDLFGNLNRPQEIVEPISEITEYCKEVNKKQINSAEINAPRITANEIKSKMVAEGAKNILKNNIETFPRLYIDISSCISGLSCSKGNHKRVTGLITGLGYTILDAMLPGENVLEKVESDTDKVYESISEEISSKVAKLIETKRVPTGSTRFGRVPVSVEYSHEKNIKLIGCDVGKNGDKLGEIAKLGSESISYGKATLKRTADEVFARLIIKMIERFYEEELIGEESRVCISSINNSNEERINLVLEKLENRGFEKIAEKVVFVENPASFGTNIFRS